MSELSPQSDYDVFEDDLFQENETDTHATIGRWGVVLLHIIKGAFVLYSGGHNIQAAITATGDNIFALLAQIVGVLILEITITAFYMAGMAGKLTGRLQAVVAALFWLIGMSLASMGIVADSRLHAGYQLGAMLAWHIQTGLFIAPVVMVFGAVLVVFTDPILSQQIANSRDRAVIQREKVKTAVLAEKANHASRKIVHNIRLGAQKQMAIEARKYYKSEEVQTVLRDEAVRQLRAVMRGSGIPIPNDTLPAPEQPDVMEMPSMVTAPAAQPMYLVCEFEENGRCPVVGHGSLDEARRLVEQYQSQTPDSQYFIIDAQTQAYVEGEMPAGWQTQGERPDFLDIRPLVNGQRNGSD